MEQIKAEIERDGFSILENVFDERVAAHLAVALSDLKSSTAVSRRNSSVYGVRDLLNLSPEIREFSRSEMVKEIATALIGEKAKIVRAIYFNKTADANWKVPWHQDLTIAVREKRETAGFSAWTMKAAVHHVQPPIELLEKILTMRFHLDDADEMNGALKVIPGSHKKGRIGAAEIKSLRQANETRFCCVKTGDCLVMRPLILHSSSAARNPKNRRVIHFEFSADDLPNGLKWYDS